MSTQANPAGNWKSRCFQCFREAVMKCLDCAELACLAHYGNHSAFSPDGKCPHEREDDDE